MDKESHIFCQWKFPLPEIVAKVLVDDFMQEILLNLYVYKVFDKAIVKNPFLATGSDVTRVLFCCSNGTEMLSGF